VTDIGVIGAGSWGTCLANLLAKQGHNVVLWAYEKDLVERMQHSRINDLYLPDIPLSENLSFSYQLSEVANRKCILLVPPSQLMRSVVSQMVDYIRDDAIIVSASKGIENDTLLIMSDVLQQILPQKLHQRTAFLSGPTFAREVAEEQPSAVVAAAQNQQIAAQVQEIFNTSYFRVYTNNDIVGVEVGGALKNVMALAAGVCDGLGYGCNTRAALITRGLADMKRIGLAMGANADTFAGLTGIGDLVLTCTGDLSRNRSVGFKLGQGQTLNEILASMNMVAEGVKTTLSTYQLAKKLGIDAPIVNQMYAILYQDKDPRQAVIELMQRELKAEDI